MPDPLPGTCQIMCKGVVWGQTNLIHSMPAYVRYSLFSIIILLVVLTHKLRRHSVYTNPIFLRCYHTTYTKFRSILKRSRFELIRIEWRSSVVQALLYRSSNAWPDIIITNFVGKNEHWIQILYPRMKGPWLHLPAVQAATTKILTD